MRAIEAAGSDWHSESDANARLIEAAPDLLERLTELMEYSDALRGSAVHKRCLDVIATAANHPETVEPNPATACASDMRYAAYADAGSGRR